MNNEWENEPDELDFEENNMICAIRRVSKMRHLCGYIAIDKNHALTKSNYNDIPVEVHGGLTYGQIGDGIYLSNKYFWFGFDCAHAGDFCPSDYNIINQTSSEDTYKNIQYVKNELLNLSCQFNKLMNSM